MQDLRLAIRSLVAAPIVTGVAVLSLALGIGANTAVFSILNSLFVRTLPVFEPQRLVAVSDARADRLGFPGAWTYPIWTEIRDRAQGFDGACASWFDRLNLSSGGGESQPTDALWVTGEYFSVVGVTPLLGRPITVDDDRQSAARPVALVSYAFWQRRFGGAGNVLGTPLTVERVPFTIVGVTPPEFFGTTVGRAFDVALPITGERLVRGAESRLAPERSFYGLEVFLRLTPQQSIDSATAALRGLQPQIRAAAMPPTLPAAFRSEFMKDPFSLTPAATGTSTLRGRYQRPLVMMIVVVGLVLFIASANIANLQLARAIARRHELSLRVALGASRWRLIREMASESLLLAGAGAVLGVLVAAWTAPLVVSQLSTVFSRVYLALPFDWRVLGFTAAVTIATTILFGVVPAVHASRVAPLEALKQMPHGRIAGAPTHLSDGLVIAQVALSLTIVVAAGLFVRTFRTLATQPVGFDADRVLVVTLNTQRAHGAASERRQFVARLAEQVAALPGVARAAVSMRAIGTPGFVDLVYSDDRPASEGLEPVAPAQLGKKATYLNFVAPGWFATYGTPIRMGRDFTPHDDSSAQPVVIVNEAFARKFLAGRNPLGATIGFDRGHGAPVVKAIVGVVADSVYQAPRQADEPIEYAPVAQLDFPVSPALDSVITVRAAAGSPTSLVRSIAATLSAANPDLVFAFRPVREQINVSLVQERLVAMVSGFFAAVALLLAGLGLYGLTAHGVASRRTEIGIRVALGASSAEVARLIASRVARLVAAGVVGGAAMSLWATRYIAPLLFGLAPNDRATYAVTALVLIASAALAAGPQVWRASRIDPAEVLRES